MSTIREHFDSNSTYFSSRFHGFRGLKFGYPRHPQGVNTEGAECMCGTFCFYWGSRRYSVADKHSHCQDTHLAPTVTPVSDLSTSHLALNSLLVFRVSGILILPSKWQISRAMQPCHTLCSVHVPHRDRNLAFGLKHRLPMG